MLEISRDFLTKHKKNHKFRFIHVSTDEVFGSLEKMGCLLNHHHMILVPYSASKAASDHLAGHGTDFGLPIIITNCSNIMDHFNIQKNSSP